MRRTRTGQMVLAAALFYLSGCLGTAHLKPPKPDPEFRLPPQDDPRFSEYPKFPEKTLNNFPKKPQAPDEFGSPGATSGRPRFGAGGPGGGY